eukprot:9648241-Karenia_brevis.AAC.1
MEDIALSDSEDQAVKPEESEESKENIKARLQKSLARYTAILEQMDPEEDQTEMSFYQNKVMEVKQQITALRPLASQKATVLKILETNRERAAT